MTGARGGLLYLAAAAMLGYLWITGNLTKLADYATGAASGAPVNPHPITLPAFRGSSPGGVIRPHGAVQIRV